MVLPRLVGSIGIVGPLNERGVISIRGEIYRELIADGSLLPSGRSDLAYFDPTNVYGSRKRYFELTAGHPKYVQVKGTDEIYEVRLESQPESDVVTLKRVDVPVIEWTEPV